MKLLAGDCGLTSGDLNGIVGHIAGGEHVVCGHCFCSLIEHQLSKSPNLLELGVISSELVDFVTVQIFSQVHK